MGSKGSERLEECQQDRRQLPLIGSYLSADFVTAGRSLILTGKPGREKTHLAVAIAYRAIQNGFDALFVTAAALFEELSVASVAVAIVDRILEEDAEAVPRGAVALGVPRGRGPRGEPRLRAPVL